jgi:hypothetical protein
MQQNFNFALQFSETIDPHKTETLLEEEVS